MGNKIVINSIPSIDLSYPIATRYSYFTLFPVKSKEKSEVSEMAYLSLLVDFCYLA